MKENILVIDDEPLIAKSVERALARSGYDVFPVTDRAGFEAALVQRDYKLVILDLNMKDLNEDEVRRELAMAGQDVKILVISGSNYQEPGYFLQKPFSIVTLREMVREIINSD